jgi:hypothetical protein
MRKRTLFLGGLLVLVTLFAAPMADETVWAQTCGNTSCPPPPNTCFDQCTGGRAFQLCTRFLPDRYCTFACERVCTRR